jgi:glycogen debranching enzyme
VGEQHSTISPQASATAHIRPEIHYVWRGPSVLVVDPQGRAGTYGLTGFFFRETRYLSNLRLEIEGEQPFLCSVAEVAANALEFSYIYPPVEAGGGGGSGSGGSGRKHGILFRDLDFDLRYRVHPASFEAALRISSRWEHAEFELGWLLDADYAGAAEAQSGKRQQEAGVETRPNGNGLRFRYTHAKLPLETHVSVEGGGEWKFSNGRLSTRLSIGRQESVEIRLMVRAVDSEDTIPEEEEERREMRVQEWQRDVTTLFAPGETPLVELTNRAMRDLGSLALLEDGEEEWLAPAAGMPVYPAVFGRDALTSGWQAAVFDRGELIRATLTKLRRLQGSKDDEWRDEQPGRIIQQARRDPLSRLGETPFDRYYGDYASPLMFIIGLGQLYAWSGEKRDVEENWDAAQRILVWAKEHGDMDGDGYLEYQTRSEKGPKHQGWKDSDNAVVNADGSQVDAPIAPCEIQGYYFAALQFMAVLSVVMGERQRALELWQQAKDLKQRFNRDFWLDDEGYVAFGLDPEKRMIRVLTSNAAQCLATGIVSDENLPRLVRRIFQPDLFSGWGIRTLSTNNPAYNPLSYHLGSVWPVENGTILFGLRRFGFDDRAVELARGIYDLARLWNGGRTPECVGGYARDERAHPGAYPRANAPQAWNQSTFAILVQTLLGMRPVAALHLLALDPVLPPWLPEVVVKRLRVGEATVTLRFWRGSDGDSHYEVVEQEGTLHIIRQPPVDSLTVGLWDRLGALAEGVLPFG